MIIDGRQKRFIKLIEAIITFIGWSYMLAFLMQVIISLLLWALSIAHVINELVLAKNIHDTIVVFSITLLAAVFNLLIMWVWKKYNYKRFGLLKRRKFPQNAGPVSVSAYFGIPLNTVLDLQNSTWIDLDETIA